MTKQIISIQVLLLLLVLTGCVVSQNNYNGSEQQFFETSSSTNVSISESELSDSIETTITETSTEENEMIIPKEYFTIINTIVEFAENYDPSDISTTIGNDYTGGVWELCSHDNVKDLICYAFIDIDDDNTAELAIIDLYTAGNRIIDLYTYSNGEIKHLLSGGFRSRNYLSQDMYIYQEGSGGYGWSSSSKYYLDAKSHDLVFVEAYYTTPTDYNLSNDGVILYHTTDKKLIESDDIDSSSVEVIDTFSTTFNFFGEYGIQEEDKYIFAETTTLAEYLDN